METFRKAPLNNALIIINMIVFLLVEITGGSQNLPHMINCGSMYIPLITEQREYYRLVTSMFLHFGMAHLAHNMLVLYLLGDHLERAMGKVRYLLLYLAGGIGGNLISMVVDIRRKSYVVSAGASGAVFAVMGGLLYVLLVNRGRLEDFTTRKILIVAGLTLYYGFTSSGVDNAAHVGGLICGFIVSCVLYRRKQTMIS